MVAPPPPPTTVPLQPLQAMLSLKPTYLGLKRDEHDRRLVSPTPSLKKAATQNKTTSYLMCDSLQSFLTPYL